MPALKLRRPLALLAVALLLAGGSRAAPPEEEEEPGKAKPVKPLPAPAPVPAPGPDKQVPRVPDTPPQPAPAPAAPAAPTEGDAGGFVARLTDMSREASQAKSPQLKAFFAPFGVAHDRVTVGQRKPVRVTPLPLLWGADKFPAEFGIVPFDAADQAGEVQMVAVRQVRQIVPFERLALEAVAGLLAPPPATPAPKADERPLPLEERLAAAEKLLVAVYFFHDSAREQNRRRGKGWEPLKVELTDQLAAVRVSRLRRAGDRSDWDQLRTLSAKYAGLYQTNAKVLEQVYAARLAEAESLVRAGQVADLEKGRELLSEYESRFPAGGNEAAKRVRAALAARAKAMLADASRVFGSDPAQARNMLQTVEKIDPGNASLRDLQRELKLAAPVLVVSARQLPERMSPALARLDSERQAVELMFEGLLEAVPDEADGVRYSPALVVQPPPVLAGLREARLVGGALWGDGGTATVSAGDLAGTLRLMRAKPYLPVSDPAQWLDDPGQDPGDPNRLSLRFKLGHPYPRGLLTFKIQPAGWLLERGKALDDIEFARRPFGSGPYRLMPPRPRKPNESNEPADVVFTADPNYGRRPGKMGQPGISEVRFTDRNASPDLVADIRGDRLHLLPDVPTVDLPKFTADNNLGGRVRVVTADDPRRVHVLAINHRKPGLTNPDLRRGLLHAIDRERILNEVYRLPTTPGLHKAMTGPFPPKSWATPRPVAGLPPLFNRDLAAAKLRAYATAPGATPSTTLLYAADDPQAKQAAERMAAMITDLTKGEERHFAVTPEAVPPRELVRRLEDENRFDLALVAVDYRDIWYPLSLAGLLDPEAARPGGRNYMGYLAGGTAPSPEDLRLSQSLGEAKRYRDPTGKLGPLAERVATQFNEAVPFVPLWQLDRHTVVATGLKIRFPGQVDEVNGKLLDPTTLFTGVGGWRFE